MISTRHGVTSILELELIVNSNSGIDYLKKNGIDRFGIEVSYKKINPQISFNSEIFLPGQSDLEYKLPGVGIPNRYLEYLLGKKQ